VVVEQIEMLVALETVAQNLLLEVESQMEIVMLVVVACSSIWPIIVVEHLREIVEMKN
jgi:hypothetical protein